MSVYSAIITIAQTAPAAVTPSAADAAAASSASFANGLVWTIAVATIISLVLIYWHVRNAAHWSLSDALSEETEIAIPIYDPATNQPMKDANGNIVKEQQMRASSSRLIALLGTIAILMLYIGAGLTVLRQFASTAQIPEATKDLSTFLLSGMVLFAPYIVNKFSNIFGWLRTGN